MKEQERLKYFYKWLGYSWGNHIGEWMDMYSADDGMHINRGYYCTSHSKSVTLGVKLLHMCFLKVQWKTHGYLVIFKEDTARRLAEIRKDLTSQELSRYLNTKKGGKEGMAD